MKTGLCLRVHSPQFDSVIRAMFNLHNGARRNLPDFPVNLKLHSLFNDLKFYFNPFFGVELRQDAKQSVVDSGRLCTWQGKAERTHVKEPSSCVPTA